MDFALQVLMVLALMGVGFAARRKGLLSETGTREMARVLVAVIYPCLIFSSVTRLRGEELWAARVMPLLAMAIAGTGFLLGAAALRALRPVSRDRVGAFLFQSTINNYLFLPLPLVLMRWGEHGAGLLVFASLGFELTLWTVGVLLFNRASRLRDGVRRMFSPPLLTLLFSLAWVGVRDGALPALSAGAAGGGGGSGGVAEALSRLAGLLYFGTEAIGRGTVAVSMLVAGSRLATLRPAGFGDPQVWGLAFLRLVAVPLVFLFALRRLHLPPEVYGVLAVIAVMPAAIVSLVFSERFGGDAEFIASTLVLTHVGAVFTVPLLLSWAL